MLDRASRYANVSVSVGSITFRFRLKCGLSCHCKDLQAEPFKLSPGTLLGQQGATWANAQQSSLDTTTTTTTTTTNHTTNNNSIGYTPYTVFRFRSDRPPSAIHAQPVVPRGRWPERIEWLFSMHRLAKGRFARCEQNNELVVLRVSQNE